MSLSFPILPDGEPLQGRILAAFSDIIEKGTNSGGYRYLAWTDDQGHSLSESLIKVARLWSKDGPTHTRQGKQPDEEDHLHVCTVKVPETVEVESIDRMLLDEIHGRILLFNESSIIVLAFV